MNSSNSKSSLKLLLLPVSITLFFSPTLFAVENNPSPFKVEISTNTKSVYLNESSFSVGDSFLILVRIVNASQTEQEPTVYSCSGIENLKIDNPLVLYGVACDKNVPQAVILKPGEHYEINLRLSISQKAVPGTLSFRIGFQYKDFDVAWSNPISIELKNPHPNPLPERERE